MIRARLVRIGEQAVSPASYPEDERAQRLIEREFNLSWRGDLPEGNRIMAGAWFAPDEAGQGLASVEEGWPRPWASNWVTNWSSWSPGSRKTARLQPAQAVLGLDAGQFLRAGSPGIIEDAPASYITSFHLPAERAEAASALVKRFPNLTLIDVEAVLRQLQTVVGQVVNAVQFVFVFTLLAGGIVLYSAMLTAFDERRYELSVMRALGANGNNWGVRCSSNWRSLARCPGCLPQSLPWYWAVWSVGRYSSSNWLYNAWLPVAAAIGGALMTMAIGWLGVRRLLATPPLLALRNGAWSLLRGRFRRYSGRPAGDSENPGTCRESVSAKAAGLCRQRRFAAGWRSGRRPARSRYSAA